MMQGRILSARRQTPCWDLRADDVRPQTFARSTIGQGGEDLDSRNRLVIALAITCLIVVAIFASFGRSLFFVQIPSITLADVDQGESASSGGSGGQEGDQYWQVAVTPETVQSVVSTLARPDSYYRELTVETLWSGGSYSSTVQFWEDSGWSHTRQTLASGAVLIRISLWPGK